MNVSAAFIDEPKPSSAVLLSFPYDLISPHLDVKDPFIPKPVFEVASISAPRPSTDEFTPCPSAPAADTIIFPPLPKIDEFTPCDLGPIALAIK